MKKYENTLILNSNCELIVYIISVLSIFRAPSLHSRTNWEHRIIRRVKRLRRETSISNADLSQEIICTWEAPETHFWQLKNSQFYTVKTLYPVKNGAIRMWRQRGKRSWKVSRTHVLWGLSHSLISGLPLLSSAPHPLHQGNLSQTPGKLLLSPHFQIPVAGATTNCKGNF